MEESKIVKDIEAFMLVQFIDVLENIESFKDMEEIKENIRKRKKMYKEEIDMVTSNEEIFDIDEIDKTLDEKLEEYSKLYCQNIKYKKIEKRIENKKKEIKNNKKEIEEIEDLIYEKCEYDAKCLYRIGILDGIKIITLNK